MVCERSAPTVIAIIMRRAGTRASRARTLSPTTSDCVPHGFRPAIAASSSVRSATEILPLTAEAVLTRLDRSAGDPAKFPLSARVKSLIPNERVGTMDLTLGSERRDIAPFTAGKTLTNRLSAQPVVPTHWQVYPWGTPRVRDPCKYVWCARRWGLQGHRRKHHQRGQAMARLDCEASRA
jgi:hypothetical protein